MATRSTRLFSENLFEGPLARLVEHNIILETIFGQKLFSALSGSYLGFDPRGTTKYTGRPAQLTNFVKSLMFPPRGLPFSNPHSSAMQVLDAFAYGGLPQRRARLWIVGVNDNMAVSTLAPAWTSILFYGILDGIAVF